MKPGTLEARRQVMLQTGYIAVREVCVKMGYAPTTGQLWVKNGTLDGVKMHNCLYVRVSQAMAHFGKETWVRHGLPLPIEP